MPLSLHLQDRPEARNLDPPRRRLTQVIKLSFKGNPLMSNNLTYIDFDAFVSKFDT